MHDPLTAAATDEQAARALGLLPIREVSRRTGVNAVTLRAWERRYGLVVPQRTPKGHRLYSAAQLERIQAVLSWLNRGVAVGQVKALLDQAASAPLPPTDNWRALQRDMLLAIDALATRRLDDLFDGASALYPPRTLCEQLLLPLLASLEQRWQAQFGAQLERLFVHGWLRSKLGARIYHNNRQLGGAPLLLANLTPFATPPELWLCAWLISCGDCPVQLFEQAPPVNELALALEKIAPRGLLLYAGQRLDATIVLRQLPRLADKCPVPLLLAGPAATIHAAELAELTSLHLAATPAEVLTNLRQLQLLDGA
ncbi:MerR family transcriptional regulator [Pseudomonas sp. UL073]|uniref:MerR family transcriptional regulator n=1 Tax=Zestomonas insulae TaxID=2809017 RepID=A0ABS2IAX8_9GAMM|nr:MerR family transcriptional regulator [Pseudomonas insulae]MBM7060177.1 MerR family transcriptional regulator [Pseudomonas insulae]